MKTYFTSGNYSVVDFKDKEFANYEVTNSNRCFNDLDEAILYCIAISKGKRNDSQILVLVDSFITMINK